MAEIANAKMFFLGGASKLDTKIIPGSFQTIKMIVPLELLMNTFPT